MSFRYPAMLEMRSSILGPRRNLIALLTAACCVLGYLASVIFADIITIAVLTAFPQIVTFIVNTAN